MVRNLRRVTKFHLVLEGADLPDTTPPPTAPDKPKCRVAPINVELTKFNGDLLQWRHFENLFTTAIATRASDFSPLDSKCLLLESLQTSEAKEIVRTFPEDDTDLSKILARLRLRFGRPQVVVPLIINKMTAPTTYANDYAGFKKLKNTLLHGYDSLLPFIGDSLSQFLLYFSKSSFSKPLSDDWEKYVTDEVDKPTLDDLRTYVDKGILHMSPIDTPSTLTSASGLASFTVSPPPTRPKDKPKSKCHVCDESHPLIRCPSFIAMDVDKRNKLVRERRLCINCFSDSHGFRTCPSKLWCRTCKSKHHTLLHKEKPPKEAATTNFSLAAHGQETETGVAPKVTPTFPNTIIVQLQNQGHTVRARAILDSGVGISLMSHSLTSSLNLRRHSQSLSLSGSSEKAEVPIVSSLNYTLSNRISSPDRSPSPYFPN